MINQTDDYLMSQVAKGDAESFQVLYDRHSSRVFGLLVSMLKERSDAEDVLQECFWGIWTRAGSFRPELGSFVAWLLMQARSKAIDRIRQRRRATERDARVRAEVVVEPSAMDLEDWSALLELPEDQCAAITLAFCHGLTREEIARSTGVPVGTVKTRIRSGLARMKEAMTGEAV